MNPQAWGIVVAAAALTALGGGLRATTGLFVSPLNGATGLGLATLSLVLAAGQLAVGCTQPLAGTLADRIGAARVMASAGILFSIATAAIMLTAAPGTAPVAAFALVVAAVACSTIGSNGLVIGEINRRVPAQQAGLAVGVVGAGTSLGQMLAGPATQFAIDGLGWQHALGATAVLALAAVPVSRALRRDPAEPAPTESQPVRHVLRDIRFWQVAGSFGVCGFHVSFMAVHMPGVIERCGLPPSLAGTWIAVAGAANIVGSIAMGRAMQHRDHAALLAFMYAVRAIGIAVMLLSPATTWTMLAFAVAMGASHMATLPPTAQLVAKHHGVERLGVLFGIVMLVHQIGGFIGIWLGGWVADMTGQDRVLWLIDITLALAAALLVWPLRARRSERQGAFAKCGLAPGASGS